MQAEGCEKRKKKGNNKKPAKKDFSCLGPQELFDMAQQKFNELDYDEAEYFYELAYQKDPYNQLIILCYAHLLKTLAKQQQSKNILQQSLLRIPQGSCLHKRYFQLAQLYSGQKAIQIFQKGINQGLKILNNPFKCSQNTLKNQQQQFSTNTQNQTKKILAEAYASVAEICMSDLLDVPAAQKVCLEALQKGQSLDPNCLDIQLQLANYYLFKENEVQSGKHLMKIYNTLTDIKNSTQQNLPYQLTLQCAKYLIEIQQYKESFELVTILKEQNTEYQQELTYLQAYCNFKMNRFQDCEGYVEQFYQRKQENKIQYDQQIQDAMRELKLQLEKVKKNRPQDGDTGMMEAEGDEAQWQDLDDQP